MPRLLLLLILAASAALWAAESRGVVTNSCTPGAFGFSFASLPDSCTIDSGAKRCPQSQPADLTFGNGRLTAPGILDLGPLDGSLDQVSVTVPVAGYPDTARFRSKRVYAVRVAENKYALLAEVQNFIGGCFHMEFRWRYNDGGNRFEPVATAVLRGPALGSTDARGALRPRVDAAGREPGGGTEKTAVRRF